MFLSTKAKFCSKSYEVLGLSSGKIWSQREIKAAYLRKAKENHPDSGGDAATFRHVTEAYGRLRCRTRSHVESGGVPEDPLHYRGMQSNPTRGDGPPYTWTERKRETDEPSRTWHYGNGARYANESTRSFYRPYTSHPHETGFTAAEVREAQARTRLAVSYQVLKYICLAGVFSYIVQGLFRQNRIHEANEARGNGYSDNKYFERRAAERQIGIEGTAATMSMADYQRHSDERLRVMREGAQSESTRDKRGGIETRGNKPHTIAVSYKGRPFTPEGLASCRSKRPVTTTIVTDSENDTECDLDEV